MLIVVGIGLTAPPIGLNVFVVSAIARDVPIARTYRGVLPFLAATSCGCRSASSFRAARVVPGSADVVDALLA